MTALAAARDSNEPIGKSPGDISGSVLPAIAFPSGERTSRTAEPLRQYAVPRVTFEFAVAHALEEPIQIEVLGSLNPEFEVLAEKFERIAFVSQLEPDTLYLACLLAASFGVLVDRDFLNGCRLFASEF